MSTFLRKYGATRVLVLIVFAAVIIGGAYAVFEYVPGISRGVMSYGLSKNAGGTSASSTDTVLNSLFATSTNPNATTTDSGPPPFVVTHVTTPDSVRAVYFSSWAAGAKSYRKEMFDIVDKTEVNAVVIDIKDYTGRISFEVEDPMLVKTGAAEKRIPDIKEFIGALHDKGVYVIGRISSFQDSYLINVHPEWAVKTKEGAIWHDYHGVKWLDAGATPVWDYLVAIGKEAYADGFDELNFDYIRFPSDGNLRDISYTWSKGKERQQVLKEFWSYLHDQFSADSASSTVTTTIPISADLFGLVTTAEDDLGIGQVLENALPNFDYISPMVYPSHFGTGFMGYVKPATKPYEVINYTMKHAISRAEEATSSPDKIRPWLQAFDLGAIYTPAMVRAQIQATYDAGLNSWLLWNAASNYKMEYFLPKGATSTVTRARSSTASSTSAAAAAIEAAAGGQTSGRN